MPTSASGSTPSLAVVVRRHRMYYEVQRETAQYGEKRILVVLQVWLWATIERGAGVLPRSPGCRAAVEALGALAAEAISRTAAPPRRPSGGVRSPSPRENMPAVWIAIVAVAVLLLVHLAAEARGAGLLRALGKLGASAAFVALALALGVEGTFERGILAGLFLSVVGDALLLSSRRAAFLAGLVAFLLAHVAYVIAFAGAAHPTPWAALVVIAVTASALRWLWPSLGDMRWPVVAYCAVISAMLWLALGLDRPLARWGALLFYLSDLLVARDRFVRPGFANRLVGLPLYYAGQVLLALAVG